MSVRAVPPVLTEPAAPRLPPVHHHVLDCGLDCFIAERRGLPVIDARLIVRGGAARDEPALAGRAWLLAELLDQGTRSRAATQIADQAELLGASLQTRASWDAIAIALHVLAPRLEPAMELLADIALHPVFASDELERKRRERLAAIMQEQDEPRVLASRAFHRFAYPAGDPLGAPLAGSRASIEAMTRDAITDLHASSFSPRNSFLIIAGDADVASLLDLARSLFGSWTGPAAGAATPHESLPQHAASVHIVDRPGAPQSELRVGLPGPRRQTPDYFPLLVANTVLGGAFTSRLNMRLREEKAYTYGAGSSFAFRAAGGPFLAATAVATAATSDAVNDIVQEIGRMAREPVPESELERARRYIVLGLPRTFETTADIAEHVGEMALHRLGLDYYDGYADAVRAVTAADVQAAAAHWLKPEQLTVAVAGDAAQVRAGLESLNIGAVHVHESI
jgi:zinc protease